MNWLLDTCVLSEYIRKNPSANVIGWLDEQAESTLFISVISLGEIEKGIIKLRHSDAQGDAQDNAKRSKKLTTWFSKLEHRFAERTLPLDAAVLRIWADLSANAEIQGKKLPVMDALLMATAQHYGLTIVTRNEKDFGLFPQVFNPWKL